MANSSDAVRRKTPEHGGAAGSLPLEHYLRLLLHRKRIVIGTFVLISVATLGVSHYLPDIYMSETLILVDPQKVPDAYVKSTVTGDVRNRLGTLSQQILSATRLQKIMEALNLYPEERKQMAREDLILKMRSDIRVHVVSDFGGNEDLQAFRISYSGKEPKLVAQVTNELASLFIDENLRAREQQATGTTEFLSNQLTQARKALEEQEAKLKDFKLKHLGEMPEQEPANLQILGQLQSQIQIEGDALARAEQQKGYLQTLISQSSPVVDLDDNEAKPPANPGTRNAPSGQSSLAANKARLDQLLARYSEAHPDVKKLKLQIAEEEAKAKAEAAVAAPDPVETAPDPASARPRRAPRPVRTVNPVLQSQLDAADAEIAKHRQEKDRLSGLARAYAAKLDAIPVREQQSAGLVRDYEISQMHYKQLLEKQLAAETATQLEIRQKGEKFTILDRAQVPERPVRPNRPLINVAGALFGLVLGLLLAVATEFMGMSITAPQDITAASGLPVLEVIPLIRTAADRVSRRRRVVLASCFAIAAVTIGGAVLLYQHWGQI